jgi:hypothetical protein
MYQCPPAGQLPPTGPSVAIVQVSGGSLNGAPNPCYRQEATWAGRNLAAYIFLDGLPSPAPPEAAHGPAGSCRGNVNCESYNFGYRWTSHWVSVARAQRASPHRWWLDVETTGQWSTNSGSNARVVAGALAALKKFGLSAGVYSTGLQWNSITGGLPLNGIPLWVAGAGNVRGPGYTAANYCTSTRESFAGGKVTLVQYGYTGSFPGAYTGPPVRYDLDYACSSR